MGVIGLAVLGLTIIAAIALLSWHRRREHRLVGTHHGVRCPRYDSHARVTVRTDPRAPSYRQYLRVTTCSLLPDAAAGVPERVAYLPDCPPYRMWLEPARSYPAHATEVSCPQHCVLVLNNTAELARQTIRNPSVVHMLCYFGS